MERSQQSIRATGDKTRHKIILSARKLFAEAGFSGVSISHIAKLAKVNRSLIFHHFTNKEELWKAVKESFANQNTFSPEEKIKETTGLRDFIKNIITQRFELYDQNPDLLRIIMWQNLEDSNQALQGGTVLSPDAWLTTIKQLQKKGEIKPKYDPNLVMILIASTISGALLPKLDIFKSKKKKLEYINMVIETLFKTLSV